MIIITLCSFNQTQQHGRHKCSSQCQLKPRGYAIFEIKFPSKPIKSCRHQSFPCLYIPKQSIPKKRKKEKKQKHYTISETFTNYTGNPKKRQSPVSFRVQIKYNMFLLRVKGKQKVLFTLHVEKPAIMRNLDSVILQCYDSLKPRI